MAKRKSALQRLREHEKRNQELARSLAGWPGWLSQILAERESTDWNDPVKRAFAAHRALQVGSDEALKTAFATFDLNPQNPFHWHTLLSHQAKILFGQRPGAPKKWTDERFSELLGDAHQASKKIQSPTQEKHIWQYLKRHNPRYRDVPYDTWQKAVGRGEKVGDHGA